MPSPPPRPSLAILAGEWLDWKNTSKPSAATLRARRADLVAIAELLDRDLRDISAREEPVDGLERSLGDLEPSDLSREAVTSAFARYARTHAASSIRRCRSTWSGFCRWLVVHREVLAANPVDFVEPPSAKRWRPKPISDDDLARIVHAAQQPAAGRGPSWNGSCVPCSSVAGCESAKRSR